MPTFSQNADITSNSDRGVIHPGHPPIIESHVIKSGQGKLRAGCVLSAGTGDGAVLAVDADQPTLVLIQDVDTNDSTQDKIIARCMMHGPCVRARLLSTAGDTPTVASDTLVSKLPLRGIYPVQSFDYSVMA